MAWLLALGTRFDRGGPAGELLLGREAAHSRRRVLHAGGDATGAESAGVRGARLRAHAAIPVVEGAVALDLLVDGGRCGGVVAQLTPDGPAVALEAPLTVLANGGAGQLWATTSNPGGATADGLAMALRAGVAVADLEFAQFHPTVLTLAGGAPFLISEAVRGEGAYLRAASGDRFLAAGGATPHPLAELAPRDVVARAIQRQMAADGADHVFLDLRHLDGPAMRQRFPTIARELAARGLGLATDLIPVAPAAHYFMGGIVAGPTGETSLPRLLALGEVACTGVHGANRLASNSLLEGLVFGLAAADALDEGLLVGVGSTWERGAGGRTDSLVENGPPPIPSADSAATRSTADVATLRGRLQRIMSRHVAVVRDASGLAEAAREIAEIAAQSAAGGTSAEVLERGESDPILRAAWELRNLIQAAGAVTAAATRREESRGAHFRADFPAADPALAGRHLVLGGEPSTGWRFSTLAEARSAGEPLSR